MIKITVEVLPKGKEEDAYLLAYAVIANDGTGSDTTGHYDGLFFSGTFKRPKGFRVVDFPRKDRSIWNLVYRFLDKMFYKERG